VKGQEGCNILMQNVYYWGEEVCGPVRAGKEGEKGESMTKVCKGGVMIG
jgi:hypothetical protein